MKKMRFAPLAVLTLALSTPAYAADTRSPSAGTTPSVQRSEGVSTEASRPAHVPDGVSRGSRADEARYAAREAAAPDAKNYKGGDVLVISATAVAVVLLVVLIIILI